MLVAGGLCLRVWVTLKRLTTELRSSIKVGSEEHFKCRGTYVMCKRRWDEKDGLRIVESLETFLKPTLDFGAISPSLERGACDDMQVAFVPQRATVAF